jgi:hypothetical protein
VTQSALSHARCGVHRAVGSLIEGISIGGGFLAAHSKYKVPVP